MWLSFIVSFWCYTTRTNCSCAFGNFDLLIGEDLTILHRISFSVDVICSPFIISLVILERSNERSNRIIRYEAGWKCLITKGQSRPTFPLLSGQALSYRAPMYPRFSNNRYFYQSAVVYEHARSCPIPSLLPNNLGFFLLKNKQRKSQTHPLFLKNIHKIV